MKVLLEVTGPYCVKNYGTLDCAAVAVAMQKEIDAKTPAGQAETLQAKPDAEIKAFIASATLAAKTSRSTVHKVFAYTDGTTLSVQVRDGSAPAYVVG